MFGASVSELYLLIKPLINIGRAVDLCVITKNYTAYRGGSRILCKGGPEFCARKIWISY